MSPSQRLLQAAVCIADEYGAFSPSSLAERLELSNQLRKIAQVLEAQGLIDAEEEDRWILLGEARKLADGYRRKAAILSEASLRGGRGVGSSPPKPPGPSAPGGGNVNGRA